MARLNTADVAGLIEGAVMSGGMMPKLEACIQALKRGVGRVRILPAAEVEVLPLFYFTKHRMRHGGAAGMTAMTGGTNKTAVSQLAKVSQRERKLLLPTYERQPILLERGQGVYVWDSTGKKYLDFLSGIGVNALGHNHPAIQRVIKRQAGRLIHISNLFFHAYQAELAARLTEMSGLDRAFFCNSGTEAWDGALKLARAHAQMSNRNGSRAKWRILAMDNSFHGRTFGALATTGQKKYRTPFVPLMPGVQFVKFNNLDDLQRKFDSTVCAVCI